MAQPVLALAAVLERPLDLGQHLVQRQPEPPDLGARVGGVTRRDRSPPAISLATRPIRSSGRRPMRITSQPSSDQGQDHAAADQRLDDHQPMQRLVDLAQRHRDDRRVAGRPRTPAPRYAVSERRWLTVNRCGTDGRAG